MPPLLDQPPTATVVLAVPPVEEPESPPGTPLPGFGVVFWVLAGWLVLLLLVALTVQWLPVPKPDAVDISLTNAGPSGAHLLGCDALGRDLLSRVLWAVRPSVGIGVAATIGAGLLGTLLGLCAGFYRGLLDVVITLVANTILAFPALVLILAAVTFLRPTAGLIIVIFIVVATPSFSRIARTATIATCGLDFVTGARALGMRPREIVFREVAPQVVPAVATFGLVVLGLAIVALAELSFLGVGLAPPRATWGGMINESRDYLSTSPWVAAPPAVALALTILALNITGSALAARFDATGAGSE